MSQSINCSSDDGELSDDGVFRLHEKERRRSVFSHSRRPDAHDDPLHQLVQHEPHGHGRLDSFLFASGQTAHTHIDVGKTFYED